MQSTYVSYLAIVASAAGDGIHVAAPVGDRTLLVLLRAQLGLRTRLHG